MTTEQSTLPVKGTVWLHARRLDYEGQPLQLTVTSITNGKVYSITKLREKIKTPVELFDKMCLRIVSTPDPQPKDKPPSLANWECENLYRRAFSAGMAAGRGETPSPIMVVQHANQLDDNSPVVKQWGPIRGGVCGFAWVTVRPGNSSFARYLSKRHGCRPGYYGGTELWVSEFGQSYERKLAFARAFAKVLTDRGIDAVAGSRLD